MKKVETLWLHKVKTLADILINLHVILKLQLLHLISLILTQFL